MREALARNYDRLDAILLEETKKVDKRKSERKKRNG